MVAAACTLFLSACGIKGPLYLPPTDPAPADTTPVDVSNNGTPSTDIDGSE
ncbi:MAG: lipoprotein [Betaproteobacteria bacterium]|nr:lipoprotein [Betaproteobacteria bacterium]